MPDASGLAGARRPAGRPGTALRDLRRERISRIARPTRCRAARPPAAHRPAATPTHPPQNKKNTPERLELKKYNKHLRRVTLHREIK